MPNRPLAAGEDTVRETLKYAGYYGLIYLAWIPLVLMIVPFKKSGRPIGKLVTFATIAFLLFIYEFYMDFVWARTVTVPIRLDLLLIVPVLSVSCLAVGIGGFVGRKSEKSALFTSSTMVLILLSCATLLNLILAFSSC